MKQLLAPDHWRPVVMGSWFSLKFDREQVGSELHQAVAGSLGSLTAPPLAVAAAVVVGEESAPTLLNYLERDLQREYGSAMFVTAVLEDLGLNRGWFPGSGDRVAAARVLESGRRLRLALTTE